MATKAKAKPKAKGRGAEAKPAKPGRPSVYSKALAERICCQLEEGKSLATICGKDGVPTKRTILNWAHDMKHEFFHRYERARILQVFSLVDEIPDIADDGRNDYVEQLNLEGDVVDHTVNHEVINRSKLRIEARQWLAEKILRQVFGNKVDVDANVKLQVGIADVVARTRGNTGHGGANT